MSDFLSNIFTFILLFLIQIIFNDFLNISPYLYLCLIPLAIIVIPQGVQVWKMMIFSFLFGLLFDAISDGVLGLNAAAAVALAASRDWLFSIFVSKEKSDKVQTISLKTVSFGKYFTFVVFCILLYLIVYVIFDDMQMRSIVFAIEKILISLLVNTIITIGISHFVLNK